MIHMTIYPSEENPAHPLFDPGTFVQQSGVPPEKHGQLSMKMTKAPEMAVIAPAIYQYSVGLPFFDLHIQARIDKASEMVAPGVFRRIFYETIRIDFQQGNIPFDAPAKIRVVFRPLPGLLPGIKNF